MQVVVGGGQEASQVTTTAGKAGRFESRFFHKVTSIMTGTPLPVMNPWPARLCCGNALGQLMVSKVGHDAKQFEVTKYVSKMMHAGVPRRVWDCERTFWTCQCSGFPP